MLDFTLFCTLCSSQFAFLHDHFSICSDLSQKSLFSGCFSPFHSTLGSFILCFWISRFLFPLSHKSFPLPNNLYNQIHPPKPWFLWDSLCQNSAKLLWRGWWSRDRSPRPSLTVGAAQGARLGSPEPFPAQPFHNVPVPEPQPALLVATGREAAGKRDNGSPKPVRAAPDCEGASSIDK